VKVLSVAGARPQFVKVAPVSRVLRREHTEILVHTGQHYDDSMSAAFFRDLQIPAPEVNLEVGSSGHSEQTAEMMRRLDPIVAAERPDVMLLYGDTNSTLAGALVAAKMHYPDGTRPWAAHVEAGLRSYNRQMPEEPNRVVADHLSQLLLAPTEVAMANLAREGLADRARKVGDVMVDSFVWASEHAGDALPAIARDLPGYVLLTMHRGDNVDDPQLLGEWLDALRMDRPVIFPVHPRTAASLLQGNVDVPPNVHTIDPVGYLTMVALEHHAALVLTDSGGVQREAYLAGVPCLTLRDETEWVETLEGGWNRLVSSSPAGLRRALATATFESPAAPRPPIFGDGHAAERIVAALEACAGEPARQASQDQHEEAVAG
jgi:UDP-N-acetylglucosamine 2-epimerase